MNPVEPVINAAQNVQEPLLQFVLVAFVVLVGVLGWGVYWLLRDQQKQRDAMNNERVQLLERQFTEIAALRESLKEFRDEVMQELADMREEITEARPARKSA